MLAKQQVVYHSEYKEIGMDLDRARAEARILVARDSLRVADAERANEAAGERSNRQRFEDLGRRIGSLMSPMSRAETDIVVVSFLAETPDDPPIMELRLESEYKRQGGRGQARLRRISAEWAIFDADRNPIGPDGNGRIRHEEVLENQSGVISRSVACTLEVLEQSVTAATEALMPVAPPRQPA
jgi:hypothetical protein